MRDRRKLKALLLSRVELERIGLKCWLQTSRIKKDNGYGLLYVDGKLMYSHQLSYQIYRGEIPPGFHIHHDCDNRNCINPGHLMAVTPEEHPRISAKKGIYKGERNRNAKYSNEMIADLKNLAAAGIEAKELSEIFEIPQSYIRQILSGIRRENG